MKSTWLILFLLFSGVSLFSQERSRTSGTQVLESVVIGEDTVLISDLPEVKIYPARKFSNRWEFWRYRRLVRNVKAAYPYAKIAGEVLKDVDQRLANMPTDLQRKRYVKKVESEIRQEFEDEVKHLTISQGRILIKLIDRETGNTSFEVLQEIKGNFSAVFWQAIARVFGSTLKAEYNPDGDDEMIEEIVLMIEAGQL